jgi:hypothetical protein
MQKADGISHRPMIVLERAMLDFFQAIAHHGLELLAEQH